MTEPVSRPPLSGGPLDQKCIHCGQYANARVGNWGPLVCDECIGKTHVYPKSRFDVIEETD